MLSPGLLGFELVQSGARRGSRVHSVSKGFNRGRVGVSEFIRVCVGSIGRS